MNVRRCAVLMFAVLWGAGAHGQALRIEGPAAGLGPANAAVADWQRTKKTAAAPSVSVSGTGAAIGKLCRNEIDVATAARPILKTELERCQFAGVEFVEVPLAFDAIVVVVNSRNTFATRLTVDELRRIWADGEHKVARWSQLQAGWPDMPVKLYGLDTQYEGSSYFNEAVLAGRPIRRDYAGAVEETALVRAVERDHLALAYVSLGTYLENRGKLKAVAIAESATATPVMPTPEAVAKGSYRPLSRPLFLYVRVKALESVATREFVEHWVGSGARLAKEARLVALSESAYRAGQSRIQKVEKGSVWDGKIAVGAGLQEVERRGLAL